jgi:hypothetical protein
VLSTGTIKKLYLDNFCNRDSFKIAQQLIKRTSCGMQCPA